MLCLILVSTKFISFRALPMEKLGHEIIIYTCDNNFLLTKFDGKERHGTFDKCVYTI